MHAGGPSTASEEDVQACAAPSPPPIQSVHDALVRDLMRPHTEYLSSFRSAQEITLSDLSHVTHSLSATSARMDQVEATFAKLPSYIAKLQTMQRNLIILKENAHKTNTLAKTVAAQMGLPDVAAQGKAAGTATK